MRKKGKSLCLFSAKGGVGKTITAINLAGVFEQIGKKVLIMDLDLSSGGIPVSLNRPSIKTIYHFADDYNNNRYREFKEYVTKYDDFIDILASPKDPRQASKIDSKYIEIALDKAVYNYDIVLIDTSHILNEQNLVMLDSIDSILFVMTNDPLDVKNMKSLISIFKDLDKRNYKILLNNSRDPFKKYFSMFELRNILKTNIDYTLSSEFYLKNIDDYVMNGEIITLQPKMASTFAKDYSVLMTIAADITKEEEAHEEE